MTVNVVDLNTERIAAWNSNHLPIHETGLPKIVRIARDGTKEATVSGLNDVSGSSDTPGSLQLPSRSPNLFFSTNVTPCIASADIIFICVNTPTKMYGVGAGASADLGALEAATRTIAKNAKSSAIIVEKSTVPCGTARIISDIVSLPAPPQVSQLWLGLSATSLSVKPPSPFPFQHPFNPPPLSSSNVAQDFMARQMS